MKEYATYKCVIFCSVHPVEQHGSHLFAWNSHLLEVDGDHEPLSLPQNIITQLMESCPEAMDADELELPLLVGISVFRGTVQLDMNANADLFSTADLFPYFKGFWRDLSDDDWDYLRNRDLERLVDLTRFAVS